MTSFILKKLLNGLLLVFTVSVLVFSMMHLMPGDPVDLIVDRKVSQERKDIIRHEYGYDRPLTVQYVDWIWKIISKGDFGTSLRVKQKVADMMDARIPLSLKLCGWMLFFEIVIAVPLGLLCAYKKDTFLDRAIINVTLFLSAVPSFWLYVLLILLFSVTLKWLPISGYEKAVNWVLPIGGGVLGSLAGTIRLTKTEVLDVFREKYVQARYAQRPHTYNRACVHEHTLAYIRRSNNRAHIQHTRHGQPAREQHNHSGLRRCSGLHTYNSRADGRVQHAQRRCGRYA